MRASAVMAALVTALLGAGETCAQGWGNVKGQVVWTGEKIPPRRVIKVDKDQNHCLSKGPLLSEELMIDPKSKGVANVIVWLAAPKGALPINPDLKAVPDKKVEVDQPLCQFVPRVVVLRAGQTLVVKNSGAVPHSVKIDPPSGGVNAGENLVIPAGQTIEFGGKKAFKAELKPMMLGCAFHGWMTGLIGVFDHPYFAVTDKDGMFEMKNAPAGDIRLFAYHETTGWQHMPRQADKINEIGGRFGQRITIKPGETLDLGKIEFKP
jgi:hypothetical protein